MKGEKKHLFDNPRNVQKMLYGLFALLGISLALEPLLHKHAYFSWEDWPGFYAVYGFISCVLLVLGAKYILRPLVKRDEDHYDD